MLYFIILLLISFEGELSTQGRNNSVEKEPWEAFLESLYADTLTTDTLTLDSIEIIDTTQKPEEIKKTIPKSFFKSGIQLTALLIFMVVVIFFIRKRFRI